MINENTLKSLFVFNTGENKGFMKLLQKEKMDKEYEDIFKRYFTKPIVDSINDLHALCKNRNVDADVKALVEQLHDHVNFDGGADE